MKDIIKEMLMKVANILIGSMFVITIISAVSFAINSRNTLFLILGGVLTLILVASLVAWLKYLNQDDEKVE
jgi:phosphotransferase system  glucose/maltose/N-acetylglucosamine-specific IIC component